MQQLDLTRAWTKPITLTLKNNPDGTGAVPVNLTGTTVELVLKHGVTGVAVTTTGDLVVVAGTGGLLTWTPDAADLAVGDYTMRVKVTDSEGDAFFPNGRPMSVRVHEQ